MSEQDFARIWQKYVILPVKNHENTQKPHLFDKILEINHRLLTSSQKVNFYCTCVVKIVLKMQIYYTTSSLTVVACIEKLYQFSVQKKTN